MLINGIDQHARSAALTAIGVDPHGLMSQYKTALEADYVYCASHHGVHRTDASCTVDAIQKFPLKTTGSDFDEALNEARTRGFLIYGEPRPCANCGETIALGNNGWSTVDEGDRSCANAKQGMYMNGHQSVSNIPADAVATV